MPIDEPIKAATPLLAWIALAFGGLCELALVALMRASKGQIVSIPFAGTCLMGLIGVAMMTFATKFVPAGIAYTIWVGTGGLAVTAVGMYAWGEPRTALRVFGALMVLGGLILLKLTAEPKP